MKSKKINITREQFLQFVRTKKDTGENLSKETNHYLSYFDQYMATGKKGNWNFAAFFPVWFLYRCMYQNGFNVIFFTMLLNMRAIKLSKQITSEILSMNCLIFLILTVFCMRYADYLYLVFASRKISKGITASGVNSKIFLIFTTIGLLLMALLYLRN